VRHERREGGLNGALNCSILDGWWDEMFDGENGWAISSAEGEADLAQRDQLEADSLFALLEDQIVPQFYERGPVGSPRWVQRVKHNLASLGPQVCASRMVQDYVVDLYEPTAARADVLGADGHRRASALATWKADVARGWKAVHVDAVESDDDAADLGLDRVVRATVSLGGLSPDDVEVQLLHGPVGQADELEHPSVAAMAASGPASDGHHTFEVTIRLDRPGRYGFAVRVVPSHQDLTAPVELGLVTWG
jgi:starch phosphorylase